MILKIPAREMINRYSAIVSNLFPFKSFSVLIEIKLKAADTVSNKAITEVSSSMMVLVVLLVK